MKFTLDELSIIEIALLDNIKDQLKFLKQHGNDETLEEYLHESETLHAKIVDHLVKNG